MHFALCFYSVHALGMEFKNPNVAADMSQILKSFHQKYVPCVQDGNNRTVLSAVPLHGDQLLEERARNVQWTFRDEESQYDRLEGLTTEHADWHDMQRSHYTRL